MIETYQNGSSAKITLNVADESGNQLSPDSITYQILGPSGNVIVPETSTTFSPLTFTFDVNVASSVNTILSPKVKREARVIVVSFVTGDNIVTVRHIYAVVKSVVLEFMQNSYQTIEDAEVLALSIAKLDNWNEASMSDKILALEEAYQRIGRFAFQIVDPTQTYPVTAVNSKDTLAASEITITGLNEMLDVDVSALPDNFLLAIRRAQIVEANFILEPGDSIVNKRRGGLMSETVGESSQMWRPGKPILLPVCRETMEELSGYIKYGIRTGRA